MPDRTPAEIAHILQTAVEVGTSEYMQVRRDSLRTVLTAATFSDSKETEQQ